MKNAYLRMGRVEYRRGSGADQTQISVYVDRYIGEKDQAHLLSIFGNDAEVGAITSAIQEDHKFDLTFPDGSRQTVGFGKDASCHKGALKLPDEKRPLRHLVASSIWLNANGSAGNTFILNYHKRAADLAWSTLVSLLGLPADPSWGDSVLRSLQKEGRVRRLSGIGCQPAAIRATHTELLELIGRGCAAGTLRFPEKNGPILWSRFTIEQALLAA